ncbi:MAG: InlB B-repeat-containing protein [Bacteroidales bacterium]|nr:InlB B-repeat-containing protein [Bacteroidales bacterium]
MPSQQFFNGVEQSLVANTFTRTGYVFIGWNTMADGSGSWFDEKASITIGKDITLYAQWMQADGEENGHAYVDLGLPSGTKWASYNVGAHKPEDYGDYFAWGETEPKSEYSWRTYKYCKGTENTLTKYCGNSGYGYNGFTDNKNTLDLSDDAARINWGGVWRMPTNNEWEELKNNCTCTWTTQNGVNGYKVISKTNGNRIFLPATGSRWGTSVYQAGSYGYYWLSSLRESYPDYYAYCLYFRSGDEGWVDDDRYFGHTVRAVLPSNYTITFDANGGSGTMEEQKIPVEQSQAITANTFTKAGYEFAGWNTVADGSGMAYTNKQVVTLDWDLTLYAQWTPGKYTVTFDANGGSGNMTAQEYTGNMEQSLTANTFTKSNAIFVGWNTASDGSGTTYTDQQSIAIISNLTLYAQWQAVSGKENGHAYIDLGLPSGTKWAVYNVGSSTPTDYGNYYSWGETKPKEDYSWENYKFGTGLEPIKYNSIDKKTSLDAEDDAARVNWGGKWRMPTESQLEELINNCIWTNTTQNGVNGRKGTSKINGNSIFLPAAGNTNSDWTPNNAGRTGYYWSRSIHNSSNSGTSKILAYGMTLDVSIVNCDDSHLRYYGFSVRAVLPSSYTITFDANGGSGTMELQKIPVGQSQTIAANTFTKAGYEFAGWNTAADGSGKAYTNEQVVTLEWDLKLYAQWTPEKYTVTFDANGGSGNMTNQVFSGDSSQELDINRFTKEGCSFWYWNTKPDGSGISYDNQQSIVIIENTTLYAQWKSLSGNENGYEYVDLGLSVRWATHNVGATKPEDYGDFYAWGEIEPKDNYVWSNYKYGTSSNKLTKYNSLSNQGKDGFVDNKMELELSDDVANVEWGGNWRMHTLDEQTELREKCTWQWTSINGTNGYKVIGPNGNSIFLPAAGCKRDGVYWSPNEAGAYWTRTFDYSSRPHIAYDLGYFSDRIFKEDADRYHGRIVRPVLSTNYQLSFDANGGSGNMSNVISQAGFCTIPENAFTNDKALFDGWNTAADGSGTSYKAGQSLILKGNTTLYAQWQDVSGKENGHAYIDLGLPSGTKWAAYNVGSSTPTGYGNYYAWGETEPKEDYSWATYKFGSNSSNLTKYNSTDGRQMLASNDDVARIKWGGSWRIPNRTEIDELRSNCTMTWVERNGTKGFLFTSKHNGNSIYLPAAGFYEGRNLTHITVDGYYWLTSLSSNYINVEGYAFYQSNTNYNTRNERFFGRNIRPVFSSNYFLSFHANGGSGNMTNQSFDAGETRNIYDNAFTKAGYDFVGWNTEMDGSGTAYANEAAISINYNTMLFAQWKVSSFTVNFDANGGSGSMSSQSFQGDTEQAIQANTFTRANALFVGWNTMADGSGTSYSDKQAAIITENLTLYAQWQVVSGSEQGHDYVDLGLSVKWATYNLGANSPSDYGNYYAWGETAPKTRYDWDRYKLTAYDGATPWLTKYCNDASKGKNGYVDNFTMLELADDAAHANYGGNWRMPTTQEMQELRDKCTWMRTSMNGIQGYKITSNINGNSIFLPAAGYKYDTNLSDEGRNTYYWTNTFDTGNSLQAKELRNDWTNQNRDRKHGCSVRPVYTSAITITFDANGGTGSMSPINAVAGLCTIPENSFTRDGYEFRGWCTTADASGIWYAEKVDLILHNTVTLYAMWSNMSDSENGHDLVDLGLSVKWATCNIGATKPEEYGDYFAWAEVETKAMYNSQTTKYQSGYNLIKYNSTDGLMTVHPSDDAAYVNWGGLWRMPTKAEYDELREKCSFEWTSRNGVNGCQVIGPNGNSIFIPAGGMACPQVSDSGSRGRYWLSTRVSHNHHAYCLGFDRNGFYNGDNDGREFGMNIRAVCP